MTDQETLERLRAAVARLRARGLQVQAPALDRLEAVPLPDPAGVLRKVKVAEPPPRHWSELERDAGDDQVEVEDGGSVQ